MLSKMKGMADMMKQAKKMQEKVEKAQEDIKKLVITKETANGSVKVAITGENKVKSIDVSDSVFSEDKEMVLDLIAVAINEATEELNMKKEEILSEATSGINIPGLM